MALVAIPTVITSGPTTLHNAAFTAVAALSSTAWTSGLYRRIEVHLKAGDFGGGSLTWNFGFAAAQQNMTAAHNTAGGAWTQANVAAGNSFYMSTAGGGPVQLDIYAQVATDGTERTLTATAHESVAGESWVMGGWTDDVATNVTGVSFTFAAASSGWLEVIGYP